MRKIRIVLADDHKLMRSGLRVLLEQQADLTVVGEASDGREAVALVGVTEAGCAGNGHRDAELEWH